MTVKPASLLQKLEAMKTPGNATIGIDYAIHIIREHFAIEQVAIALALNGMDMRDTELLVQEVKDGHWDSDAQPALKAAVGSYE